MTEITLAKGTRIRSKYKRLANELNRDIKLGKYYHKIPAFRELAEKYSVNLNTVAKSVNTLVDKGILYTEKGIGTFINEDMVKNMHLTLWLVSEQWEKELGSLRSELFRGLRIGLKKFNFEVEFRMIEMEAVRKGAWGKSFSEGTFQGIITTGITLKYKDDIIGLIEQGIPCISLLYRENGVNFVDADNVGGAYEAVSYLIKLGHRNIAFLPLNLLGPNTRDNFSGYKKALKENHIVYREVMMKEVKSLDRRNISEVTRGLIHDNPDVTAIFTSGDLISVEVMKTLQEMGLKVPEDISVVGFDDLPVSRYCHPSLTTVGQPFFKVGKLAAERLAELIEGKRSKVAEILPTQLIIRKSCSIPKNQPR
jgi:LacI family transcriptional regulator